MARLREENAALRRALRLLSEVANLVRVAEEPEATAYAILTGVTAGVGLGMNRAMIFERVGDGSDLGEGALQGRAAVGPWDVSEADRVWRAIEAEQPSLETLYEAGLRRRAERGALDARVRSVSVRLDADSPGRDVATLGATRVVHAEEADDLDGIFHPPTTLAAPMRGREGLRGVLVADNRFTGVVPDAVTRLVFEMVADHAGRALFSADRFARVAMEARVDALTGLDTRRVGLTLIEHAVAVALASDRPVSLLMIDVDRFKLVNDSYGHPAGDAVLAQVASRVRRALRRGERAFRYGGEEIGVILEDTGAEAAFAAGERLRLEVGATPFEVPALSQEGARAHIEVTCSVGAASSPPQRADPAALIAAADEALLRAKRGGRNRVERADGLDAAAHSARP